MMDCGKGESNLWYDVTIKWVNCLQLTENPIVSLRELADGNFFCEILNLLFRKSMLLGDVSAIFNSLQTCLQGRYSPNDWISFSRAKEGNEAEIIKITSVLIGISVFQEEVQLFRVNPAEKLPSETQISIRTFLLAIHNNKRIVTAGCLPGLNKQKCFKNSNCLAADKCTITPRVLFPEDDNDNTPQFSGPNSRGVEFCNNHFTPSSWNNNLVSYSSAASPLGELFQHSKNSDSERMLLSEKINEITSLHHKLRAFSKVQEGAQEELITNRAEIKKLTSDLDESKKTIKSLQEKVNLLSEITCNDSKELSYENTNDEQKVSELMDKLKKEKNKVDKLETQKCDLTSEIDKHQENVTKCSSRIKQLELENREFRQQVNEITDSKQLLVNEINQQHERQEELQKYCSELKEIIEANRQQDLDRRTERRSAMTRLSFSPIPNELLMAQEDLGMVVVDIQLKEALDKIKTLQERNDRLQDEITSALTGRDLLEQENEQLRLDNIRVVQKQESMENKYYENMQVEIEKATRDAKTDLQNRYLIKFESMKQQFKTIFAKDLEKKDLEVRSLEEIVENLKRERASNRAGNVELNQIIHNLRKELAESQKNYSKLNANYDSLVKLHNSRKTVESLSAFVMSPRNNRDESMRVNLDRSASTTSILSAVSNSSTGSRLKVVPFGSGTLFACEDEDDLQFTENHLARFKADVCTINDKDRVQEIQRRNTLVPPHMRSCYPAEFQFFDSNVKVDEENIRAPCVLLPETFKQNTSQPRPRRTNEVPFADVTNRQRKPCYSFHSKK